MVSNVGSKWHLRERMVVGAKLVASDTSGKLVKGEGLEWQQDSCRCHHKNHSGTQSRNSEGWAWLSPLHSQSCHNCDLILSVPSTSQRVRRRPRGKGDISKAWLGLVVGCPQLCMAWGGWAARTNCTHGLVGSPLPTWLDCLEWQCISLQGRGPA